MAAAPPTRGAVVITGASTGIGYASALHLSSLGFQVFAGVRRDEDAARLRDANGSIEPLKIDVTDQASIDAAAQTVREATGGRLVGLVNNAGIAVPGPLEYLPMDEFRRQIEVNLTGQVAVTQGFLPMLRPTRGRIVNIGSIGGRVGLPLLGPYAASKHAIIRPGPIATEIWERGNNTADELLDRMPAAEQHYGPAIAAARAGAQERMKEAIPPQEVAEVVAHALTSDKPRTRYLVGRRAKLLAVFATVLPDRLFDRLIERMGKSDQRG
jgi:NAD(P)-dependent dehydrogenase (short-subunit alcohol dehydrogenase family)